MNKAYAPELGQAVFGQPTGDYSLPDWVESMFDGLIREVGRVYWNTRQESWEDHMPADFGALHVRPYSWDDEDAGPNFWLDGQEPQIRWYKHPGRGMSCTKHMTAAEWIAWHDAVKAELRRVDDEHRAEMLRS